MPYIIQVPPTHDFLPPTLHPFNPLGAEVGSLVALSSTSTLDLTLVNDFREWGWQVRYLDLGGNNIPPSLPHRCGSISQSDDGSSLRNVPTGSHSTAQKWYEGYKRKDAKHSLRHRICRVWEQEHGRRIRSTERESKKPEKGLRERLHDLF